LQAPLHGFLARLPAVDDLQTPLRAERSPQGRQAWCEVRVPIVGMHCHDHLHRHSRRGDAAQALDAVHEQWFARQRQPGLG